MKDNNDLYLDLLEKVLLGVIYEDPTMDHWSKGGFDPELRLKGLDLLFQTTPVSFLEATTIQSYGLVLETAQNKSPDASP